MKAIEIECSGYEWWGDDGWKDAAPYSIGIATIPDGHSLPNAPVTIYVMTPDPLEAAQLLRIAAAQLESNAAILAPLNEPRRAPSDNFGGVPF